MNNLKYIVGALVVLAIAGAYVFPEAVSPLGTSDTGSTFNSAKTAAIVMAPQSNAASSTSILNGDSNSRYITNSFIACNNFGTSPSSGNLNAVTVQIATTTTSANGLQGNANFAGNFTFSTSTLFAYNATSTEGVITGTSRVWPASTYLTFNLSATSTAGVCTVGVNYVPS